MQAPVIKLFKGSVEVHMYDLNNAEGLYGLLASLISPWPSGHHRQTFRGKCTGARSFSEGHLPAYLSYILHFMFKALAPQQLS